MESQLNPWDTLPTLVIDQLLTDDARRECEMELSDEEKRLLAQLEESLIADDPRLAQRLGGKARTSRQIHRRRATLAGLGFLLGIVMLVVGLQTVWVISVLGFIAMFASTVVALGSWQKASDTHPSRAATGARPSEPFLGRMEDRWRRRQEGQG